MKRDALTISVGSQVCQNLRQALRMEWLETNGLGGYASSTVPGCHTRRYHGLLVVTLPGLPGRYVLLSKFEDSVLARDREFFLACHRYPGVYHPHGHQYLQEFRQAASPVWRYQIGELQIEKSLMLVHGRNTVLVRYFLERGPVPVVLRLKPLLAFRGFHELRREDITLQVRTYGVDNGFKIQPYNGLPPLYVQTSLRSMFYPAPVWYKNFEYLVDAERGYDYHEDLFQPGVLEVALRPGQAVVVAAALEEQRGLSQRLWSAELARRSQEHANLQRIARSCRDAEARDALERLLRAGTAFLVRTPSGRPTIVAGYHWFEEWGRDLLIALPGLTFCSGRTELGIAMLAALADHERDGLLPNCFGPDRAGNSYNSVDAALWYFWAAQQMQAHTGDWRLVRTVCWPLMERILHAYLRGTVHGIFMNPEGLLHAGHAQTQLTWMDAMVNGVPVTPRHGYAVEINALWYNAVCFADELAARTGLPRTWPADLAPRIRSAFRRMFWLEQEGYLADHFADGQLDTALRPNQVLAVSLPYSPLEAAQMSRVVERVRRELLTPYGLRTLSPTDPRYHGRYGGDPAARDAAYHQGTVWPWLLGPFGEAALRVADDHYRVARFLLDNLRPLLHHINGPALGLVPEVFDGDPPHAPNGCIAQAWSTAELLRLLKLLAPWLAPQSRRRARRKGAT